MHYTCVSSPRPGQGQVCPRCCVERELAEADPEGLKWHEVEVRAPKVRLKAQRLHPTDTFPEFDGRPKKNVNIAGMVSQMVMNSSASTQGIREVPAEFKRQMELRERKEADDGLAGTDAAPGKVPGSCYDLGTVEDIRASRDLGNESFARPYYMADVEPLSVMWRESVYKLR